MLYNLFSGRGVFASKAFQIKSNLLASTKEQKTINEYKQMD